MVTTPNGDWSIKSDEWLTFVDDSVIYYLSDGSTIRVELTHSGWQVCLYKTPDAIFPTPINDDLLPYRAGAMEFVRGWLKRNKLTTVPSEEQRASAWYREPPKPKPDFDPVAFARELDGSMAIARQLDAMINGGDNG